MVQPLLRCVVQTCVGFGQRNGLLSLHYKMDCKQLPQIMVVSGCIGKILKLEESDQAGVVNTCC